ncbi:MAG: cell division protein FtsQ/DivIB [Syntrophothermus sp.]
MRRINPIFLILLALAFFGFIQSPLFAVTEVEVRGASTLKAGEVLEASGLALPANFFSVNTSGILKALERVPRIEKASVQRFPPNHVIITVKERVPVGAIPQGKEFLTFDSFGIIVALEDGLQRARVPIVTGVALNNARPGESLDHPGAELARRVLLATDNSTRSNLSEIHVGDSGEIRVYTREGIMVFLGDGSDLAKKMSRFEGVLRDMRKKGWHPEIIDLRTPDTPVVKLRGRS